MTAKRMVGVLVALLFVLGLGGVALANGLPERASFQTAGSTTTAAGGAKEPKGDKGRFGELRTCVKAKVDAGATKADAAKACAAELGLPAGPPVGKGPRGPKGPKGGQGLGRLGKATHGELVVPKDGGGYETVTFDRGAITAVDAGSLTLKRADGPSVTLKLVDTTTYKGKAKAPADLTAGDEVDVLSAGGVARAVHARKG
jgi:hypothetical protein